MHTTCARTTRSTLGLDAAIKPLLRRSTTGEFNSTPKTAGAESESDSAPKRSIFLLRDCDWSVDVVLNQHEYHLSKLHSRSTDDTLVGSPPMDDETHSSSHDDSGSSSCDDDDEDLNTDDDDENDDEDDDDGGVLVGDQRTRMARMTTT
eukprot:267784-Prorocentrum_minimum.AAC.1